MSALPEFVGTVHIFLGPYRGNPIALYLCHDANVCRIAPTSYPWNRIIGEGESPNRAAADFEEKWKQGGLAPEMFSGPHWEGGIKPEKPKPAAPPKPAAAPDTTSEGASAPAPESPATAETIPAPAEIAPAPAPSEEPPSSQ